MLQGEYEYMASAVSEKTVLSFVKVKLEGYLMPDVDGATEYDDGEGNKTIIISVHLQSVAQR